MEKFLKRKSPMIESIDHSHNQKIATDIESLPADPGQRQAIWSYDANDRDRVRRAYLLKGPCQPFLDEYPQQQKTQRRFVADWFKKHRDWLEYSISKDSVYCLYCYLFRNPSNQGGADAFIGEGFKNWKKKEKLDQHVGKHNSFHNEAKSKCNDLINQKLTGSVSTLFSGKLNKDRADYRVRLSAAVDCVRFLLRQGLAFRGNDESDSSINKGNYLELFHWLADHSILVQKVSFQNAPQNCQLTSSDIQKDICTAATIETTRAILKDIGDACFTILVDESRDISTKEEMSVVLRYVNKQGKVIESFLGIEHVSSTTAASLKDAIDRLFSRHGLSISRLRGQGYDGASNMQGELKGLKTLILQENPCAFYVHFFAHQLQLGLVAVAKNIFQVQYLFEVTSKVMNVVGASCKRQDILRAKQHDKLIKALNEGEILTGRGLNQETNLQRAGDTRWGSHYGTLVKLTIMFSSVIEVLEIVMVDGVSTEQKVEARVLLDVMQSFEFVFTMHFMKNVLGITNDLSLALPKKDQEIENAMRLVNSSKILLQAMRDNGWDSLFDEVSSFCFEHEIMVLNMEETFIAPGRPRRNTEGKTNNDHFRFELFNVVLDKQLVELNSRFSKTNTQLLHYVACFNPRDSFSAFNKENLISFARLYPKDFSTYDLVLLNHQLDNYIIDVRTSNDFSAVNGVGDLAQKMVETRRHIVYPLVYMLVTLALTLPVSTASVERSFSAMKIVKNRMRNRIGDDWLNACLVPYIEKEVFSHIENEAIMQRFQVMTSRREQL